MAAARTASTVWTRFEYRSTDGLLLAGRKYGWEHQDALPAVCLPGLTRNAADFHELALYLSESPFAPRRVLCLDYRGRGMSQHDRNWRNYNIMTEAEDVANGMVAAGISSAAIIGTSRGGLICLVLGATRPALLRAVILNDVGPEVNPQGLARIKNYVGQSRDYANWQQAIDAVRTIGAPQFPDWPESMWQKQARLLFEEKGSKVVRRYDGRIVKSLASVDLDNPLPAMWPQFAGLTTVPMLVIRGANSDILTVDTFDRMREAHPDLTAIVVPGQGHAPDLGGEQIREQISRFIQRVE
jgi:pimeloyl-ACP methyl ester carboxylesterase